jgi:hypothetical protein
MIIVFFVIPTYVPQAQQDDATHWAMVAYSALLFLTSAVNTEFSYANLTMIFIFIGIIAFQASGVYWWIPKYVPAADQAKAVHWMVIASSMFIFATSIAMTAVWRSGYAGIGVIGDISSGGRRRR